MRRANVAPATLKTYGEAVRTPGQFLAERGMPTDVATITREYVEAFIMTSSSDGGRRPRRTVTAAQAIAWSEWTSVEELVRRGEEQIARSRDAARRGLPGRPIDRHVALVPTGL